MMNGGKSSLLYLFYALTILQVADSQCTYTATKNGTVAKDPSFSTKIDTQWVMDEEGCGKFCTNHYTKGTNCATCFDCVAYSFSTDERLIGSIFTCYAYADIDTTKLPSGGKDTIYTKTCVIPVNCIYSAFTAWTACSVSCGNGTQTRARTVQSVAQNGGIACDNNTLTETQKCNPGACPTCVYSWTQWSACSVTCGVGQRSRGTELDVVAHGSCTNFTPKAETQTCDTSLVCPPIHCAYSQWTVWTACSVSCGSAGTQRRERQITVHAQNGGNPCNQPTLETHTCETTFCPVNCIWTWTGWSSCSTVCGGGVQYRNVSITQPPLHGGASCSYTSTSEVKNCNTGGCPVNCVWTWSAWGPCNASCGGGYQHRNVQITQPPLNGGAACNYPSTSQMMSCATVGCPVNCVWTWTAWGSCSVSCGGGDRYRHVHVTQPPLNGGAACNNLTSVQSQPCGTLGCAVDCVWTWTSWTTCSKTCGLGTQTRFVQIVVPSTNGGALCNNATASETQNCNVAVCPCQFPIFKSSVNPTIKPSVNFFIANKSDNCEATCKAHTGFTCEAYTWAGPNSFCYLHGAIADPSQILFLSGSPFNFYWNTCKKQVALALPGDCWFAETMTAIDPVGAQSEDRSDGGKVSEVGCELHCHVRKCTAFAFDKTTGKCFAFKSFNKSTAPSGTFNLKEIICTRTV